MKLKGDSGFIAPGLHVAAPYDNNGKVFIDNDGHWLRVDAKDASPDLIIKCSSCDKPATMLDHYYPYYIDMNKCDDCQGDVI